jgi:hypothetical protein
VGFVERRNFCEADGSRQEYQSRVKVRINRCKCRPNFFSLFLSLSCVKVKHVIEGKLEGRIEMTGRRGRRRKQLLDDLKEKKRYRKLKEEALDRTLWRTRFGREY